MKYIPIILMAVAISLLGLIKQVNGQNMNEGTPGISAFPIEKKLPEISAFPIGNKLPEMYAKYFTGQAYLAPLTQNKEMNCPILNVTFEPGCRNNWHSHSGGQILVVTGGMGYYQAKGESARLLLPGDVVEIPANVIHWHGASPDQWFSHLAIETNPQNNEVTWLEVVDDEQYSKATAVSPAPQKL